MDVVPVPDVLQLVAERGGWLLFALAVAETCFVTGLVVPSGLATSAATVLAVEGRMPFEVVLLAAVAGGFVGDSAGYWVGRLGRERLEGSPRRWARVLRGTEGEAGRFFGRHPAWSVTTARLVSFVRTLMPMAAGVSGLPYRRYLRYEIPGVLLWAAMYVAIGVLAEESWDVATRIVGVGWTLVFATAGVILWLGRQRRRRGRVQAALPRPAPEAPPTAAPPAAAPPPGAPPRPTPAPDEP